jgi:hypothetical protein
MSLRDGAGQPRRADCSRSRSSRLFSSVLSRDLP